MLLHVVGACVLIVLLTGACSFVPLFAVCTAGAVSVFSERAVALAVSVNYNMYVSAVHDGLLVVL